MDTNRKTPTPEDVAAAIADAETVEWPTGTGADGKLEAPFEGLRQVAAVAAAFRQVVPPASPPSPGSERPPLFRWGPLEALEKLGEGSFGEVFRARDPRLDREVALKLQHPLRQHTLVSRSDFIGEARRLARVRHPNVVVVHGADVHDGRTGLWLELVDGCTLAELVAHNGPMGAGEAVAVGMDLCAALAAVHAAGLVHADVKPSNVMRERGGRIVLMDFGAGLDLSPGAATGPVCGTPAVTAPEILRGSPPTPAADLYSLGSLLYFLLTARFPFDATTVAELVARQDRGESVPLADRRPDLPHALVQVVERALDPDPERRFRSAGELRRALARVANASSAAPVLTGRGRHGTPLRVAAVLLLGGASLAGGLLVLNRLAATSGVPAGGAGRPLRVNATLYCDRPEGAVPLIGQRAVRPGDRLFLALAATEDVHVYVLNEDERGAAFILFPLPGAEPRNPLPAHQRHRLPGEVRGHAQDWVVTSVGGRERFLVVAARRPLPEIEGELTLLASASAARAPATEPELRGVGGLAAAPTDAGRTQHLNRLRRLLAELAASGEVWMQEVTLENPST